MSVDRTALKAKYQSKINTTPDRSALKQKYSAKNTTLKKENTSVQTLAPLSPRGITSVITSGTDNKITDTFGNVYYDDTKIPNKMQEFKQPQNLKSSEKKETVLDYYKNNSANLPSFPVFEKYLSNANDNKIIPKVGADNKIIVPKIPEEQKVYGEKTNIDKALGTNAYVREQIKEGKSKLINSYEGDIYKKTYASAYKYGFNPDTFTYDNLYDWANSNNFKIEGDLNTGIKFVPKREGIFGKKLTTEEAEDDLKMLEALALRNENYIMGKEHPIMSSALTIAGAVPRGVMGTISNIEDAINVSRGKEIDLLSNAHRAGNTAKEIRQSVDENHASKAFGGLELPVVGNVGSFLYNAGMSMGDSAITLATGQALFGGISSAETARKAISAFVSGTMASSAAADAVVENKKRGFSDKRALALGIATGLVEAATEKFSIDNILKQPKTAIKALGRGFVAEGSEEAVSEVANGFIDFVVNGSDSELVSRYNEYKKLGYDDKISLLYTFADSASQVASSFLAGGLSGMAMSGTAYSKTALQNRSNAKSLGISTKQYNALSSDDNKMLDKVFTQKGFSEIVKPLSEINTEITKLKKEGKTDTKQYFELLAKKADATQNVVRELQKNSRERNKYAKLSSDINVLKQQYPHAPDEKLDRLSKLVATNENVFHNSKFKSDMMNQEVFAIYNQQNEEIHKLVDELTFEERKHTYKNMSFASVEDSAAVSDMDIELFDKLSEMFGTKYVIDSTLQYAGEYKDGTIFINPASKSIHQNVYAHELVHHGENSPQYQAFKEEVLKGGHVSSWAESKGYKFDSFKNMYKDAYKHAYGASSENLDALVENEIVADYVADILTQDISYLNKMAQQDTGFRKILSYIRDFFAKIADKLHLSNSDARYAKQLADKFTEVLNTVDNSKIESKTVVQNEEKNLETKETEIKTEEKATDKIPKKEDSDVYLHPEYWDSELSENATDSDMLLFIEEEPYYRADSDDEFGDYIRNSFKGQTRHKIDVTEDTEIKPYTDREKSNWKNSNTIIVYENEEQFESFVAKVLNNEDTHKKIYFGKIPDVTAQMVFDKTGVDVSGKNIALKGYEIRKILLNSHGNEKAEALRGQAPITIGDLKNIPFVIANPDDVNLSDREYEGKPALLFEKNINSKNYVLTYVSKKHHDIAIETMYKKRSLATAENANALSSTPKATSSTASTNNIPQQSENVNNNFSKKKIDIDELFTASDGATVGLSNQIDKWLSGQMRTDEMFRLGNTPVVLRELGAKNLPVMMSQEVLSKVSGIKHDIALSEIRKIPQALADPIMIFNSATVPNSFVVLTELTDKNNNDVVIALHLNRKSGFNYINRVSSVYGKNNIDNFVVSQTNAGNLKYYEKNKSQEWLRSRGLQLPKLNTIPNSNNIILEKEDIVKKYFNQNAGSSSQNNFSKKKIDIFDDTYDIDLDEIASNRAKQYNDTGKSLNDETEKLIRTVYKHPNAKDLHTWGIAKRFKAGNRIFANYDISRNLDYIANGDDKLRKVLREEIEKPFFKAKAEFAARYPDKLRNFHKIIVQQYGIKQGSKESAALQWYGEGFLPNQINILLEAVVEEYYNPKKAKKREKMLLLSVQEMGILLNESKTRHKKTEYTNERNEKLEKALKKFNQEINTTDNVEKVMAEFVEDIKKILAIYENKEGKHQPTLEDKMYELYTLEDLKREFPDNWFKIAVADKYMRKIYDGYLEEINLMLEKIYPYVEQVIKKYELEIISLNAQIKRDPSKIFVNQKMIHDLEEKIEEARQGRRLLARKDYYHHFREISSGLRGFAHLLKEDFEIPTKLATVSADTKPKTKWAAFMQHRGFGEYTADAVGGMINYMYTAEYKLHFDPFISKMRTAIASMAETTKDTRNINPVLNYLTKWTNDICGKSDGASRALSNTFGRARVQAFKQLDGYLKGIMVKGNIGTAFVQASNLPNMAAYVDNPKYAVIGAKRAISFLSGNDNELFQSAFLKERYMDDETDIFDDSLLHKPDKFASSMISVGDKLASYIIWYSAYEQGKAKGVSDPVYYADDITRRCVAGRGIGEIPLAQKNLIVKTLMPFQIETNNFFNLVFEQLKKKNFIGLFFVFFWCHIFNLFFKKVIGRNVLPDLIEFVKETVKRHTDGEGNVSDDVTLTIASIGGRIASNSAYGNALTSLFKDRLSNKELLVILGDSSRYGLNSKAADSILDLVTGFVSGKDYELISYIASYTPYGGQLKKMINAAQDYNYLPEIKAGRKNGFRIDNDKTINAHYKADGTVAYVLDDSPIEQIRAFAFGSSSTKAAQRYYDGESASYNEFSTEKMRELKKIGINEKVFDIYKSELKKLGNAKEHYSINQNDAVSAIDKIPNLTNEQKNALFLATNKAWKGTYNEAKVNVPLNKLDEIAKRD